jgi:hypothetical protein
MHAGARASMAVAALPCFAVAVFCCGVMEMLSWVHGFVVLSYASPTHPTTWLQLHQYIMALWDGHHFKKRGDKFILGFDDNCHFKPYSERAERLEHASELAKDLATDVTKVGVLQHLFSNVADRRVSGCHPSRGAVCTS